MLPERNTLRTGLIFSVTSAISFSLLAIFYKIGYQQNLSPGVMLSCRFVLGFMLLTPYMLLMKRHHLKVSRVTLFRAFICGVFFYGLQSYLFAASLQYISAATAGLILYLYPLVVLILAAIFFKSTVSLDKILALILIIIGSILVYFDAFSREMNFTGLLLATSAMFTFAAYILYLQKSLINVDSTVFSYYVIGFTGLQCLIVYQPIGQLNLHAEQWLTCFLLAFISTLLAIILLYKAIERIGSSYTAIFSSIEPAGTMLAAALILHESLSFPQIIGMLCIIGGIAIPNLMATRRMVHFS